MLQQKLARIQADNMIYQDQISRLRRRVIDLEQYRIKYELLLQKQTQQSPLHRSRRVDQINNMNKKIEQNNDKWTLKIKLLQGKYENKLHELQQKNFQLQKQLDGKKSARLNNESNLGQVDTNNLRQYASSLKNKNTQLASQIIAVKSQNNELSKQLQLLRSKQLNIKALQQQYEQKLRQSKQQQKQFYRQNIVRLQSNIKQMQQQISQYKMKVSPQRQQQINRLLVLIKQKQQQQNKQISRYNELIKQKNKQISKLISLINISKQQALNYSQHLQSQLNKCRSQLFNIGQQHHYQLITCRQQMQILRQKQISILKQSFQNIQDTHDSQRQQWKLILKQQQQQLQRIKHIWQQQKIKFTDQKNKLKSKINQLKSRNKKTLQQQKMNVDNQTFKLIQSLKQIDEQQNKYNDYQNSVTFFGRQLKRATSKIQQKQRQCAKLLNQLKTQRQQFQNQTQFIKNIQRQQIHYYKQKLLSADQQNTKLLQQLRSKDKYIRDHDSQHKLILNKLTSQNQQLDFIIKQMEKDYSRLTDNKKNIYQSYRSQRDLVFTGKNQLNQQRKNKWLILDRQKNQLEIAYKQRQKQIKTQYDLQINQLHQQIIKMNQQKQLASAQVDILKVRVKQTTGEQFGKSVDQQNMKDFHKKLATLDLEISLSQNLYSTLKSVRDRQAIGKRSQLDQMSVKESEQSMTSRQQKIHDLQQQSVDQQDDNVAPSFAKNEQRKSSDQYKNFSFKPQQPMIKVTKVKKNFNTDMSFQGNNDINNGNKTPAWRL